MCKGQKIISLIISIVFIAQILVTNLSLPFSTAKVYAATEQISDYISEYSPDELPGNPSLDDNTDNLVPYVEKSSEQTVVTTPAVSESEESLPTESSTPISIETANPTGTLTVTPTPTPTILPTEAVAPTPIETVTPTILPTNTVTPAVTPTIVPTETVEPTPEVTPTPSPTETPTIPPTVTVTPVLPTPTPEESLITPTATALETPMVTPTPQVTMPEEITYNAPEVLDVVVSSSTITLTWEPIIGASGYIVYIDGIKVEIGNVSTYEIEGLKANTTYTITIMAFDEAGNFSPESEAINVLTLPDVVSDITTQATDTSVTLSWDKLSEIDGYDIEVDGELTEGLTSETYIHSNLLPNSKHSYRVRAKNASGCGEWSELISVTTMLESPLLATTITEDKVIITWGKVQGADEYEVIRDGIILCTTTELSYVDEDLVIGETYVYYVIAKNAEGNVSAAGKINVLFVNNTYINSNKVLNGDLTVMNLYLTGGTLNLNGYKLTVKGNLYQTGGTMYINGGSLEVEGDYKIEDGNYYCYAYLKMTNENDYVKVNGNFYTKSYYSHKGCLTAGVLEVKGNFTEKRNGQENNFYGSETHRVLLSGDTLQEVYLGDSVNSCFNILEITNVEGKEVKFTSPVSLNKLITNGCKVTSLEFKNREWKLTSDELINGELKLSGSTINLNGYKLTVKGNLYQTGGTMYINGGRLEVEGDYKIEDGNYYCYAYLKMTNENDYVKVNGNFYTKSYYSHKGCLTAGVLEVKGNFTEKEMAKRIIFMGVKHIEYY
ncbi:fibronectin type III domain-containing protein [Acetivibrio clariflavus]|uniref:Fibronectin type III domain-containing protein n=1 Tax=Acetivibrio clariflavus (strain DSM 19732 / NBRC 101661 / EBR45) TaxID=720554 RepID=G8M230_ACECE|nr:fibronectin type III domain-containing protein [Acetivibrio clariflavus]AEV68148.1 fibronectin type III domain-containing protein [Acetivibrio clariflavus DSM 19732]